MTAHQDISNDAIAQMHATLAAQKQAFLQKPNASLDVRIDRLKRLRSVLVDNKQEFCEAISEDFTSRSVHETMFGELLTVVSHIDLTIKHLGSWMKDEPRSMGLLQQPASGWVQYQPLGVVGIISPWNYPMVLSIGPMISALAAGNHIMLKPSSNVPKYTALLASTLKKVFAESLIHVVQGSGELSKQFSKMPFDQITFTGSSRVGKQIMRDAAENLTPVLLELGGKSPAIIHPSYSVEEAAVRLVFSKYWNAGQTCVAPDYIMVPKGQSKLFAKAFEKRIIHSYPNLLNNPDYTSMISSAQKQNVLGIIEDARANGATVEEVNPANERLDDSQKIAPHIVYDTDEDMRICQEEIFGPVLLIKEYETIDQALEYVAARPRPLAFYYFDNNDARAEFVAQNSISGHFGINQSLTHVTQDDLPFGGVGNSGTGKYHGFEGFRTMSNARSVMKHGRIFPMRTISPPFNKAHALILKTLVR